MDRLDTLPEDETGTVLFAIEGVDAAGKAMTAALTKELGEKVFLGLRPKLGRSRPARGPGRRLPRAASAATEASVQVASSDGTAQRWVPFGKFTVPVVKATDKDKSEAAKLGDALAEGVLGRLGAGAAPARPAGEGEGDLPGADRERVAADPQRSGGAGRGDEGRRDSQAVAAGFALPRGGA